MNSISWNVLKSWSAPIQRIYILGTKRDRQGNDRILLQVTRNGLSDFGDPCLSREKSQSCLQRLNVDPQKIKNILVYFNNDHRSWNVVILEDASRWSPSSKFYDVSYFKFFSLQQVDSELQSMMNVLQYHKKVLFQNVLMIPEVDFIPDIKPQKLSFDQLMKWPWFVGRASIIPKYHDQIILGRKSVSGNYTDLGGGCHTYGEPALKCLEREVFEEVQIRLDPELLKKSQIIVFPSERNSWWLVIFYHFPFLNQLVENFEKNTELSALEIMDHDTLLNMNKNMLEKYTLEKVVEILKII